MLQYPESFSNPVSYDVSEIVSTSESELELMAYERVIQPGEPQRRHTAEKVPLIKPTSFLQEPLDKRYGVFLIFGYLGLSSLLPWNFFITAKKYFDYKFRNTSLPSNVSFDDDVHTVQMQKDFESYLAIVSNGSNLLFMILTVLLVRKISVKVRVVSSTLLIVVIFVVTCSLTEVNTDTWQNGFFIFTLVMATFMSGCQSVLTGSVLGLSAVFPPIYSQSTMIGQAAGGTFSALCSILTHATGGDPITSGLIYFLIATVVTILSLVAFLGLHFMEFSRYYMVSLISDVNKINEELVSHDTINVKRFFHVILKKTWMYCLSVCLVFLVTLSVFPAVCSLIKSEGTEKNSWTDTYFTPVGCFLLFNVWDFLGRLFTFICKFPGSQRPGLLLFFTVLRIGFIPLLMLCNVQPREHLPVYLKNDAYPMVLISLLGLTNGYFGTLCMTFGPLNAEDEHLEGTGIVLALAMTIGLAGGSALSFLFVNLI
ncbi:equilibrative nucleoside transporter 3-like isoform X2 [Physella acuta]|uniref:equilibrative nucleoside transporter 3-like isoform X2 n=1 Tax=Physella acuta TaxID=109671 RepID=UPI0027DC60CB|nr:equilibrative nucleoside transporter 3-like isoform X2 [Physella acuta]